MLAPSAKPVRYMRLRTALRFAWRELRGGLRGFGVFIACIALGVMAIAGVGSVAASLSEGLAREGRTLLGGDAAFSLMQREAKPDEIAFLRSRGEVSVAATLRAMARTGDGRLALVERRQGHPEAEVADLQKVVEQFPQSRDARRELGIAYYQQHRADDAVTQFEALQGIDPDDVAAHYNLAILYRRKGMKERASEQAALYATKRIDPAAPTYSLDFLRKHPEISTESVPWHMHTDLKPVAADANAPAKSVGGGQR